jgi:selenocysteine lyase/cysteine desulfurase
MDIAAIRREIPAVQGCSYLNMSYGPKPRAVTDEVIRMTRLISEAGPLAPPVVDEIDRVYEGARVDMAGLLGASTKEIALTRNVSEGINMVATGIDWAPGDEVIITDEEHPSGSLPWMNLAQRRGVVVRKLELAPYETEGLLDRLDELITERTRLVCLSHVATKTGYVLPAREVCDLARGRSVPVLLDGAHAVGLIPVDVKEIGANYYSGCGHKWLFAPQGTGFLYVAEDDLDSLELGWIGANSASVWDLDALHFEPLDTAAKFEFGTRDLAVFGALSVAIRFAREIGIEQIAARSWELTKRLREGASAVSGVCLESSLDPRASTAITRFDTSALERPDLMAWFWDEHKIIVAARDGWMRISTPYFVLEEEIDRFVGALGELQP